jgi:hypothetical protein
VYLSDQSSKTILVLDLWTDKLVGVIRLGEPTPGNLTPLYRGQLLVHGIGLSLDHRTLVVVSLQGRARRGGCDAPLPRHGGWIARSARAGGPGAAPERSVAQEARAWARQGRCSAGGIPGDDD